MDDAEIDPILVRLAGYWPTPALTPEEVAAWTETLNGPSKLTAEEVTTLLKTEAATGREWRPRAGEMIALVQGLRRQRILEKPLAERDLSDPAPGELEESTEHHTPDEWAAIIKEQLREQTGPMMDALDDVFGGDDGEEQ